MNPANNTTALTRTAPLIAALLLVSACGETDSPTSNRPSGATDAPTTDAPITALHQLSAYPAGGGCPQSGVLVEAGNDTNRNSQIDHNEIQESLLLCNNTYEARISEASLVSVEKTDHASCPSGAHQIRASSSSYTICNSEGGGAYVLRDDTETAVSAAYTTRSTVQSGDTFGIGLHIRPEYQNLMTSLLRNTATGEQYLNNLSPRDLTASGLPGYHLWEATLTGPWGTQNHYVGVNVVEQPTQDTTGEILLSQSAISFPPTLSVIEGVSGEFNGLFLGGTSPSGSTASAYAVEIADLNAPSPVQALNAYLNRLGADGELRTGTISIGTPTAHSAGGLVSITAYHRDYTATEMANKLFLLGLDIQGKTFASLPAPKATETPTRTFHLYIALTTLNNGTSVVTAGLAPSYDSMGWDGILALFTSARNVRPLID